MKKTYIFIAALIVVALAVSFSYSSRQTTSQPATTPQPSTTPTQESSTEPTSRITVVAHDLEIPWDIAFLPDGNLLVSERVGKLSLLRKDGTRHIVHNEHVSGHGEGGLLGITLHPNFTSNHWVYLYMTSPGTGGNTENRVERYRLDENKLTDRTVIIRNIPGAIYHDGGRMEFGPDGLLYITTGDATTPTIAQNKNNLGGKILRIQDDGGIPNDNPFGNAVYSYGHRNPQGLAWDAHGRLWSTEHGRSGALSGLDEINLIHKGSNYGWPEYEGDKTSAQVVVPALHSGARTTWAPASAAYHNGSLFFGGLRGESLYEAILDGEKVKELKAHLQGEFGRIRTVRIGPDGMLYIMTSNRDGRGVPRNGDDKIIRIHPDLL